MTLKYIRDYYGVPAYRGRKVMDLRTGEVGRIMSGTHYVAVRMDANPKRRWLYHPEDLGYLPDDKKG